MTVQRARHDHRDFLFRFAVLGAAHFLAVVAGFAVLVFVSRWFGPDALGVIVLATNMMAYANVLATLGVETHAVVELASGRTEPRQLVADVFAVRLAASLVVHALLVLVAMLIPAARENLALFVVYGFSLYPFAMRTAWVYQAWGQTHVVAAVELVLQLIALALTLVLAWAWPNLMGVALARLGAEILVTKVLLRNVTCQLQSLPRASSVSSLVAMVLESIHLSGIQLVRGLAFASDAVILGALASYVTTEQLGQYGAALRIFTAATVFVNAYFVLLLPKVAAEVPHGWGAVRRLTLLGAALFAAVSCLGVIPVAIFADRITAALFGNKLVETGAILRVLMFAYPFVGLRQVCRAALVATKLRKFDLWLAVIGTLLHIVLKVLAALYIGYASLAWVWFVIESLSVVGLGAFLLKTRGPEVAPKGEPADRSALSEVAISAATSQEAVGDYTP